MSSGVSRERNRIRKLVARHLGFRNNRSYENVGKKIAEVTGWHKPESIGEGLGRRLVVQYFTEYMNGTVSAVLSPSSPAMDRFVEEHNAKHQKRKGIKPTGDEFYLSRAWRELRYLALKKFGSKCQCCGGTPESTARPMHVDQVKPRFHYPELELELSNLQILCEDCNLGKGAWDETDWRINQILKESPK